MARRAGLARYFKPLQQRHSAKDACWEWGILERERYITPMNNKNSLDPDALYNAFFIDQFESETTADLESIKSISSEYAAQVKFRKARLRYRSAALIVTLTPGNN